MSFNQLWTKNKSWDTPAEVHQAVTPAAHQGELNQRK